MIVSTGDFVKYKTLTKQGHARISKVGEIAVYFTDVRTGEHLQYSKDSVEFSPATIADPKAGLVYQIIDINLPEDDPEIAQVLFSHKDEGVDPNVYVLDIIYSVSYESHPGNPNCWSSDWDYMGYTECEAEVVSLQVLMYDPSKDTDHLVGTGKQVDGINIDDVMMREVWEGIRRNVESNYCKYVETITEDDYDA